MWKQRAGLLFEVFGVLAVIALLWVLYMLAWALCAPGVGQPW